MATGEQILENGFSYIDYVRVFRYQNDKEQSNYFAVGTYGCMLYIYNDKGEQIYSKATVDKVLCIQTSNENLIYSTLSGEIYSIPLKEALADAVDLRNEIEPALIIKSTSGFRDSAVQIFLNAAKLT